MKKVRTIYGIGEMSIKSYKTGDGIELVIRVRPFGCLNYCTSLLNVNSFKIEVSKGSEHIKIDKENYKTKRFFNISSIDSVPFDVNILSSDNKYLFEVMG